MNRHEPERKPYSFWSRVACHWKAPAGLGLVAAGLLLAGCSTGKNPGSETSEDGLRLVRECQPYLLYLQKAPHPSLYVEVEAVEGCIPSEKSLDKMTDFLKAWCDKPGGIRVVRGRVIPRAAARGRSPRALAREYLEGPPWDTGDPARAYLYVLFYDDALCFPPLQAERDRDGKEIVGRRPPKAHPYAESLPYPAIYFNTRYLPKLLVRDALVHEAGHELGLACRTNAASDFHCADKGCLMNANLHVFRWLFGGQREICSRCREQLAEELSGPPLANQRFVGPVLVRRAPGYAVLSLPERARIVIGDVTEETVWGFFNDIRSDPAARDGEFLVSWRVDHLENRDPEELRALGPRLKGEPFEPIRKVGPSLALGLAAEAYDRAGKFSAAAAALREATVAAPDNDWAWNLLGWTLATCRDASTRDGKEAVSAAMKACELTKWKNGEWIDTLAAAYAESGDFKAAVEHERKALAAGAPTEEELQAMRARLDLYEKSQPYHDAP